MSQKQDLAPAGVSVVRAKHMWVVRTANEQYCAQQKNIHTLL
jgi:hypothetical protein